MRRQNLVLQEICGNDSKVLVVFPEHSEEREPSQPETALSKLFSTSKHWCTLNQHEHDDDIESYWHLHVAEVEFTGSGLNSLFRMVANDVVGNIMIICPRKGVVFHPYDCGADVVLASEKERNRLKEKYREWLSSHAEGF